MRVTIAVVTAVSVLFVGVIAISESAQQTKPALNSTAANESYAAAEGIFGGVIQGGGSGIVLFGVAAIVVVGVGLLVTAGRSGR